MRSVPGGTSALFKPGAAHLQIIRQSQRDTGTHTVFSSSAFFFLRAQREGDSARHGLITLFTGYVG